MKEIIQRVKGTREFYPEDMAFRTWLYKQMRAVSESFAYQEYDGPFLEKLDLYAAKSGEELVKEQSFVFMDRGVPYDPLAKDDPDVTLSLNDREIGGLGIFMVKKSMDDMVYTYENGQNVLTIRKRIG